MGVFDEQMLRLTPDPSQDVGFSDDVARISSQLFDSTSDADASKILNDWLQVGQPCLFGKIAAKYGLLRFCILREGDLGSEEQVRDKIQVAREAWTRSAFKGDASGFVIALISQRLAEATPNDAVRTIATRLCSLYLEREIVTDEVFMDELFLEVPGNDRATFRWDVGANYFAAHGDKRWWHDHRIPGGIAFSMNSVGHMVKSGRLATALEGFNLAMGLDAAETDVKLSSLPEALVLAMQTISRASSAVSGKATALLPLQAGEEKLLPTCPVKLPASLTGKNHCEYSGHYHTDYTLPSEYFREAVERPADVPRHILDFTYLFHDHVDNPAFSTMGEGRRIRDGSAVGGLSEEERALRATTALKVGKAQFQQVPVDDCPRLQAALRS